MFIIRIHQYWHACVVLFKRMRQFYDVLASCADVCVLFLTCMCVLNQRRSMFSDKNVFQTNVYILISTHECFFIAYTSFLRCMCLSCWRLRCVSNVYVCYVPTHTHIFGQRCVLNKRINHIFHACVDLILRIHHFCDPCAGLAYGCIMILTCTSIESEHMYIIETHALFLSSANVILLFYASIFLMVASYY